MIAGESPEWLPPGFTMKTKYRSGKKVKYYLNDATGKKYNSKNEVIRCAAEYNNSLLATPQEKNADDNGSSSFDKVDEISDKTNGSAWLPNGWTVEERRKKSGSSQGSSYKVYIESSTGSKFYSKTSVTRYLNDVARTDIMNKQNKIDNVDEPLPDTSLQISTMTNTGSISERKRKANSLVTVSAIDNVDEMVPEKSLQIISTTNTDDNGPSSFDKVDAISDKANGSAWLPDGWTVEERRKKSGSSEGSLYKVYIESSTGRKFYSKASVTRYLNDVARTDIMTKQNKIDNVDDPPPGTLLQISPMTNTGSISEKKRKTNSLVTVSAIDNEDETAPEKSPQIISTTNTDGTSEQRRKENSPLKIDNVGEPSPDMSPQVISTTNTDGILKKKRKSSSFVTVAIETTTADDLPSGWIKEIRTRKSGDKIRKDPFYTDPVSGYMFRSKPDALRYLKTNDIGSCACKPLKRELDDIKSIENRNPSSTPANQKLSMHKRQPFLGEESNGGGESSVTKSPAKSDTKTLRQEQVNHDSAKVTAVGALCLEEKVSCGGKSAEKGNNPEPESVVSKKNVNVMAVDVAMSSPVADPSESGGRNKVGSRKSKKRRETSTPSRTSKRLAGSEPEMKSNLDLNERSLRASPRGSTAREVDASSIVPLKASDMPQTSNIEPAKEAVEHAVVVEETHQDASLPKEVEKPPPTQGSAIPEEQLGATGIASKSPLTDSQQSQVSQLCYDFGDSWTDPLEFALKTLRGELPIEDSLMFQSCFQEPLDDTISLADGCLKQSQFNAPINFQSEFPSHSESSKKQNAVDPPPATPPSFSAHGNLGFSSCSGFNFQPSTEVGKKDSQTKFNP